jgi:hypothetical protein
VRIYGRVRTCHVFFRDIDNIVDYSRVTNFEIGPKPISNPKSEILKLDSTTRLEQFNFEISDFGFEMGFRPISSFLFGDCAGQKDGVYILHLLPDVGR